MSASSSCSETKTDLRSCCGFEVTRLASISKYVSERVLGLKRRITEAEPKLGIRKPDLPILFTSCIRACLEILRRYTKSTREHSNRPKRGPALTALDPRNVGVAHTWRREFPLREPSL